MIPVGVTIPNEFTFSFFNGLYSELAVNRSFSLLNIFPEDSQSGQILDANIINETELVVSNGFTNLGGSSYHVGHPGQKNLKVSMMQYIISDIFDASDSVFKADVNDKQKAQDVRRFIAYHLAQKKLIHDLTLEYVRAQILLTGEFELSTERAVFKYDYDIDGTQIITLAGGGNEWDYKWNVQADANPKATFEHVIDIIEGLGGGTISEAIANRVTWNYAFDATKMKAVYSDKAKDDFLAGKYSKAISGVMPVSNNDTYKLQGDSAVYKLIPDGYVIFKIAGSIGRTVFGESLIPISENEIGMIRGRYSYPIVTKDPVSLKYVVGSTVLPFLKNKYSFACVKVY